MADTAVLSFPAASLPLSGADVVPVIQGSGVGANKKATLDAIRPKGNAATSHPGASDDETQGYSVGSRWLNTTTRTWWNCVSPATGAAAWTPMGTMDHPGYATGRIYPPQVSAVTQTGTIAANTLYASWFPVLHRVTIAGLTVRVVTAAAGHTLRLGIYSNVNARPGALLAEGTQDLSTASAAELTGTGGLALTLEPALYWFAVCCSGAPVLSSWSPVVSGFSWAVGGSTFVEAASATAINRLSRASVTYVAGSPFMPSTFGAATLASGTPGSPLVGIST